MGPLTRESRPRLASKAKLRWDRHDKKYLLLYPERGLVLNETASAVVRLLDGEKTIATIARELGGSDDEIIGFLERLRSRGLLEDGAAQPAL
jgi:coenzyme PQQ biosynthesis protein PqqD